MIKEREEELRKTENAKNNEEIFNSCKQVIREHPINKQYELENKNDINLERKQELPKGNDQYSNINTNKSWAFVNKPNSTCIKRAKKGKHSKVRAVLDCFAECFCPLYAIRRDFENILEYTIADSMEKNSEPTTSLESKEEVKVCPDTGPLIIINLGNNGELKSHNNESGCLYFDNFGLDNC